MKAIRIWSIRIGFLLSLAVLFAATSLAAPAPPPGPGGIPDYFGSANWAFSPPLKKFVDSLPPLGCATTNNLNQCVPVANPDTVTYPGTDYYEIEVRQYTEKLHTDLPATTLRGYVQVNNGTDPAGANTLAPAPIHYLGPLIIAKKDRPVRLKFTNKLPLGTGGDLFIPVDTTVMGAGMGPLGMAAMPMNYTQNRATIHLHGGQTPWISDGTPHQWITPSGETTPYDKGVSVHNVPDMPNPAAGSQTFFFPNQQSARLMFYHDHSYGITRLNVYAGEAAGYMITDTGEKWLQDSGLIPTEQIPLIIQDKSFVDAATIASTDPTWNWGTTPPVPNTGDLWYPHVYSPAQNPFDVSGANPFGRWHYAPWFWPPQQVTFGPVANPYYDPACVPSATVYCEPPQMPGVPNPSMPGESFFDTPLVNGTAFPYLNVQPKSYRLRILNAANDRFWNLQTYVADSTTLSSDGRTNTEVKMVPAVASAGFPASWPIDGRAGGVPDPANRGPSFIQIGTDGGFLPAPAVIANQPITWNNNPTTFNFGNVQDHALLVAPAERADVIIDFSQYAGKTIILYNDAPAPFPALDPRCDYYTGAPDLSTTGGHSGTQIGFGPNTRTIMQFRVAAVAPSPAFNLAALQAAFASTPTNQGIFQAYQNPILVGQAAYDPTYNLAFPVTWPNWGVARIQDNTLSFNTTTGTTLTLPMQPKGIHDEMGAAFDKDYGRMSGKLGVELTNNPGNLMQQFILYNYIDPATEIINDSITPMGPVAGDGTQVWKITHNGVDTHPIHFHLFDAQLINRVGWDGLIRLPDANELGWKDTIRVSPLEDTIVALRPTAPKVPFVVPNSVRLLDPTMPQGSPLGFTNVDPVTGQPVVPPITNQPTDFGWEYVWHCHILSHEEMDMMRPIKFQVVSPSTYVVPEAPTAASATAGNAKATISFSPPTVNNGTPITSYVVTADPGGLTATRSTSPITMTGLLNGTVYKFTVAAVNSAGTGLSSLPTNAVMPVGPTSYSITASTGVGGLVSPVGITMVNQGMSQAYAITPNLGYNITDVKVDNVSVGAVPNYTFNNVLANHAISATFAIQTFTITTTAGLGGTISPTPSATVNYGANQTFTITPNVGYHVTDVVVDGISQGALPSYTFTSVIANHTIAATFAINTYTLASSTGPGGNISPLGTTILNHGASQTYTITPSVGYHIADVLVDGVSVGAVSSYTFSALAANHTITASFAINTFTVTATAGANGTISCLPAIVNYGGSSVCTATPNVGYAIATLTVNGAPVTPISPYTFTNVTANQTIGVTFALDTVPVHSFQSKQNGSMYFFTISDAVKNNLITNLSASWTYKGAAFYAYATQQPGTVPVHSFQNKQNGSMYFFTISDAVKNNLITNLSASWTYKGAAFYAYATQQPGTVPVHSFQNKQNGSMYFFTISDAVKNNLITNLSASWTYKGAAFYAYATP